MATGGPNHEHHFDPYSGWCAHCNLRDDGKLIAPGGAIYRPGKQYTDQELQAFRERMETA